MLFSTDEKKSKIKKVSKTVLFLLFFISISLIHAELKQATDLPCAAPTTEFVPPQGDKAHPKKGSSLKQKCVAGLTRSYDWYKKNNSHIKNAALTTCACVLPVLVWYIGKKMLAELNSTNQKMVAVLEKTQLVADKTDTITTAVMPLAEWIKKFFSSKSVFFSA